MTQLSVSSDEIRIDNERESGHSLNNLSEILSRPVALDLQSFESREKICSDVVSLKETPCQLRREILLNTLNISAKVRSNFSEKSI